MYATEDNTRKAILDPWIETGIEEELLHLYWQNGECRSREALVRIVKGSELVRVGLGDCLRGVAAAEVDYTHATPCRDSTIPQEAGGDYLRAMVAKSPGRATYRPTVGAQRLDAREQYVGTMSHCS